MSRRPPSHSRALASGLAAIAAGLATACEPDDRADATLTDPLVVEAILGASPGGDTVRIGLVTPLDADAPPPPPSALAVSVAGPGGIATEGTPLGDGAYVFPAGSVALVPNAALELAIDYAGQAVTSLATVPEPPRGLTLSRDTVRRARITSPQELLAQEPAVAVTATWSGPAGASYVTTLTPLDPDADPVVDVELPGGGAGGGGRGARSLLGGGAEPSAATVLDVEPQRALQLFTGYELAVYAVGPEYVALYGEASAQGAGTLNEAPDNVEGGYGLFTAVSVARDTIWVVPE